MSEHIAAAKGQIASSILLPGDPLRAKFIAENFLTDAVQYNDIRNMLGYTGIYKGTKVSVQGTGMGMPSIGIYTWELMNDYDCENLIRIGTAGGFGEAKVRDIVFGVSTHTDSNYGYNFKMPGTIAPTASWDLLIKAKEAAESLGIAYKAGPILSSDIFYSQREDYMTWEKMGALAVEMEAAALYMNAAYLKRNALCIVTISNHLTTGATTTPEERQLTFTDMMKIALEAAVK